MRRSLSAAPCAVCLSLLYCGLLVAMPTTPAWALSGTADTPAPAMDGAGAAPNAKTDRPIESFLKTGPRTIDGFSIDLAAVDAFYQRRGYRPAFDVGFDWATGKPADRTALRGFWASLAGLAAYHGLIDDDLTIAPLESLLGGSTALDAVKLDVLTTAYLINLARDLHGDDLDLSKIYPGWHFEPEPVDIVAVLADAVDTGSVSDQLNQLAPQDPAYLDLARHLKRYRDLLAQNGPWPSIPAGPTLRPGDTDSRIKILRERLKAEAYDIPAPAGDLAHYDPDLAALVTQYQIRNGLAADGAVGGKTAAALNTPIEVRIGQIIANMARWRSMPRQFPERYIRVNIPNYALEIVENGSIIYRGLVMVGRPDRKTPFIDSALRSVIFNPSWHVPAKIAREDILPKLRKDPHYLEKMGFVINGTADDPHGASIDWNKIKASEFHFRLRQSPGELNSLGRIKFDFDNDFSVYMHGTPHMELFEKNERSVSSGCVRLREPDVIAEIVLAGNDGPWTQDKIQETIETGKTKWLKVEQPIPLYFLYWTVLPSKDNGPAEFRSDIYAYDSFLLRMMQDSKPD